MDGIVDVIFELIFSYVQSFFAEFTIICLLIGLAMILLGATIIFFKLYFVFTGQKVEGIIIGAVREVKIKIKDGKVIKKRLSGGSLFPVFEYTLADGSTHRDKGNAGGSHVYRFKTGQKIKLIVKQTKDYNYVRGANSYAEYIFGSIPLGFGIYAVYIYISSFASYNLSTFIWLGAIISVGIRFKDNVIKLIKDYKLNKENYNKANALRRDYDPSLVRPIEEYVEERKKQRQKHMP